MNSSVNNPSSKKISKKISQSIANETIYLGADHGGYELKQTLKDWLDQAGYQVKDLGAYELDAEDDYPKFAAAVARAVSQNESSLGILICRSGGGMVIAANKIAGIRAVEVFNQVSAEHAKQHNHANVISLAADWMTAEEAKSIVKAFLKTSFSDEPRHQRRIKQIHSLE